MRLLVKDNWCYYWKSLQKTSENNKEDIKKIEITFNIMFLPNVKYPAAVKVGH